jgi:hypothetical protein
VEQDMKKIIVGCGLVNFYMVFSIGISAVSSIYNLRVKIEFNDLLMGLFFIFIIYSIPAITINCIIYFIGRRKIFWINYEFIFIFIPLFLYIMIMFLLPIDPPHPFSFGFIGGLILLPRLLISA